MSGNTLALEDGGTVNLAPGYLDNTDDQTATEVDITDSANNFTGTTVEAALAELATGSTDDQALSLSGNTLALEDGGTVNLAGYLDNTDDQALSLSGNTLALEDGGTVNLAGYLDNTDDQKQGEVNITDSANNFTGTTVEAALAELADESSDNQQIDNFEVVSGEINLSLQRDGVADQSVNLISSDADNNIQAGTDGALYLNIAAVMPVVNAAGKINGNGTAASIYGATVSRINEGDYQITFTNVWQIPIM